MNNWFQNLKSWLQSLLYILAVIYIISSTFQLIYNVDRDKISELLQVPIAQHLLNQEVESTTAVTPNTNSHKVLNPSTVLVTIFVAYIVFFIRAIRRRKIICG